MVMRRLGIRLRCWATWVACSLLVTAADVDANESGGFSQDAQSSRRARKHRNPPPSTLAQFTKKELSRLEGGKSVKRAFTMQRYGSTYHAGISYRMIDATPMDVIRVLREPGSIVKVIPYGVEATVLSEEDGVTRMRISQGKSPVIGTYTIRMEWDLRDHRARFWMDPAYDADLEDVWGVFSAREVRPGKTLVSFGFAFNIGGVGSLLEGKAQKWGLTTSDRIVKYVKKRRR